MLYKTPASMVLTKLITKNYCSIALFSIYVVVLYFLLFLLKV